MPKARAKKIGYLMLKNVEEYARINRCHNLLLNTTPYLTKALDL